MADTFSATTAVAVEQFAVDLGSLGTVTGEWGDWFQRWICQRE